MASKLFVGNLDFKTTQDEVASLFEQVGPVTEVFLPTDRATGRPRGFAFVQYESEEHAQEAMERFDGYELSGRALRVNEAQERPPRRSAPSFQGGGPGPGWGGGGGGGGGDRFGGGKPKGSRRNIRSKKRSL